MKKLFLRISLYLSLLSIGVIEADMVRIDFSNAARQQILTTDPVSALTKDNEEKLHMSSWSDRSKNFFMSFSAGSQTIIQQVKVFIKSVPVENRWIDIKEDKWVTVDWDETKGFFFN